jgi:hypothetical protein
VRSLRTRKLKLGEEEADSFLKSLTPGQRVALMWPLALQAWMFKTGVLREPRLRRDVGRVVRGGR